MQPIVYVAGPMTHNPTGCVRQALDAAQHLWHFGAVAILPQLSIFAEMYQPRTWEAWLRDDLAIISRCNGLIRLPGESVGADLEVAHAKRIGLPVYHWHDNWTAARHPDGLATWLELIDKIRDRAA